MLTNVIRDVSTVPTKVAEQGQQLLDELGRTPARLASARSDVRRFVRRNVYAARDRGETNLFTLQLQALEAASDLVDRAAGVKGLSVVSDNAKSWLGKVEHAVLHPPLEGYDDLNVRTINRALRDLDRFGLLRVRTYESAHKNRKTILDAVEREMGRRARLAAA